MKRLVLAAILAAGALNATDFTVMTAEELVAVRGTVAVDERDAFREELQGKVSLMSTEEKEALGISPNGYGDMTETAPQDGTGLGNTGESTGGGMGSGGGFGSGGDMDSGGGMGSGGGFGSGGDMDSDDGKGSGGRHGGGKR